MIERMFDSMFGAVSDEELVAAIEDGVRQEAIAGARRMAAIAELTHRRLDVDDDADVDEKGKWAVDPWASACAEVSAAMAIGARRASGQMRIAEALREHLPRVAALYCKGALSSRLVSTITWGTQLVDGAQAWADIDAAIAERAVNWERMSEDKLRAAVDVQVSRFDPDAHRRSEAEIYARGRDITIGACDDEAETVSVWGRLLAPAGMALKQRVAALVGSLCAEDPRDAGERRSDAVGAIAEGHDRLACRCGSPSCPTADVQSSSSVVVHVIADQAAVEDAQTALTAQQPATDDGDEPAAVTEKPAAEQPAAGETAKRPPAPALLLGRGVLPNALLAEAIRNGATLRPIRRPGVEPEPRYRPSAALAEFVRMRDLFCRFPGCTVSADRCDLDHAVPWPYGPTHASNLNCKCRHHHLMKTFWTGIGGWSDEQCPDGTVIWTAPSGTTYTTQPGSRLFFPTWDVTTAALPPPQPLPPHDAAYRGLMMPRRKRPRAADIAAAIKAERSLNDCDAPPF
jgi:hypothetical protein